MNQFWRFLNVLACECSNPGQASTNSSCNDSGACTCNPTFTGDKCDTCIANYYMVNGGFMLNNMTLCLGIKKSYLSDLDFTKGLFLIE